MPNDLVFHCDQCNNIVVNFKVFEIKKFELFYLKLLCEECERIIIRQSDILGDFNP